MSDCKRTNTTLFLLPLLGSEGQQFIKDPDFSNTYLSIDTNSLIVKYKDESMLSLSFNEDISDTLRHFKKGHFSKISNQNKVKILEFWNCGEASALHEILYPKRFMYVSFGVNPKQCEIWPKPDMKLETINN